MPKTIYTLIAAITISASIPRAASAAETDTPVKVQDIGFFRDGSFFAKFSGRICNDQLPDAQVAQDVGQVLITDPSVTSDGIRGMLTLLQSAKLTGANVVVWTDGVSPWPACRMIGVILK